MQEVSAAEPPKPSPECQTTASMSFSPSNVTAGSSVPQFFPNLEEAVSNFDSTAERASQNQSHINLAGPVSGSDQSDHNGPPAVTTPIKSTVLPVPVSPKAPVQNSQSHICDNAVTVENQHGLDSTTKLPVYESSQSLEIDQSCYSSVPTNQAEIKGSTPPIHMNVTSQKDKLKSGSGNTQPSTPTNKHKNHPQLKPVLGPGLVAALNAANHNNEYVMRPSKRSQTTEKPAQKSTDQSAVKMTTLDAHASQRLPSTETKASTLSEVLNKSRARAMDERALETNSRKRSRSVSSPSRKEATGSTQLTSKAPTPRRRSKRIRGNSYSSSNDQPLNDSEGHLGLFIPESSSRQQSLERGHLNSSRSDGDPLDLLIDGAHLEDEPVDPLADISQRSVSELTTAIDNVTIVPRSKPKLTGGEEVGRFVGREYGPYHFLAKDLPHDLANEVNALPEWAKDPINLRRIFESSIMTNTTHDEPHAPYIRVINDVDNEATPPFEFYYTNLMWHGENVPPPDHNNLQGCDCIGACDPRSETCACGKRQRKALTEVSGRVEGFIYDDKGRLKYQGFPIFECNDACECTEDCKNRVCSSASFIFIYHLTYRDTCIGHSAGPKCDCQYCQDSK